MIDKLQTGGPRGGAEGNHGLGGVDGVREMQRANPACFLAPTEFVVDGDAARRQNFGAARAERRLKWQGIRLQN